MYSTEKILEDSGITVAPPEHVCSGRIHVQGKPQQEGFCIHCNSDIAESGESGSEHEEEEESTGEDEGEDWEGSGEQGEDSCEDEEGSGEQGEDHSSGDKEGSGEQEEGVEELVEKEQVIKSQGKRKGEETMDLEAVNEEEEEGLEYIDGTEVQ
ncbi:hypothetical protein APHAL10511_008384, partial [Amanita phalloides]